MKRNRFRALKRFADRRSELDSPALDSSAVRALEDFGRVRLSKHFFMRDFLYSEISAVHGIPNVPNEPDLAIEAGSGLCEHLLEPLRAIFGHVAIRSAFRNASVNRYGNRHKLNCARNPKTHAKHIWDHRDADGCIGATACVVIPWFIDSDRYRATRDWRPLAWFIHDRLPYSEMCFFPKNAAFNLAWRSRHPRREIRSYIAPKGILTRPGLANHDGDHSACYPGFPGT